MIHIERHEAIYVVRLNRPEVRNAVDRATAQALADAFRVFDADDSASVAVLGGHFCAGADLKAIGTGETNRVEPDGDGPMGPTRLVLSKPVIAAISGYAVAGGLELALWCDLRVAEEDAVMGDLLPALGRPADRRRHRPASPKSRSAIYSSPVPARATSCHRRK